MGVGQEIWIQDIGKGPVDDGLAPFGLQRNVATIVGGKDKRQGRADIALADSLAIDVERRLATLAETTPSIGELHTHLVIASGDLVR